MRKRAIWILVAVAAVGLIVFSVVGRVLPAVTDDAASEAVPVSVENPRRGDIERTLSYAGTLTPAAVVTLTPKVAGKIERILVKEGDLVRQGQLLALMEDDVVSLQAAQAASAPEAARAQREKARKGVRPEELASAEASVAVLATPADRQPIYRPRGPDPLGTLFRRRFPDFQAAYEQRYAATYGRFRLPLIIRAASAFRVCGDWSQGIARIRCPSCGFDRFRPFSCKSYLLCPSCAQKRTLLVGEYLSEDLLLTLPHRQFVWTIPKVLRLFLRHDRELLADLGRLTFDILRRFFCQAAGGPLRCAGILVFQT